MLRRASSSAEQAGEEKGGVLEALLAGVSHLYACCRLWMHKAGHALCCWVRGGIRRGGRRTRGALRWGCAPPCLFGAVITGDDS